MFGSQSWFLVLFFFSVGRVLKDPLAIKASSENAGRSAIEEFILLPTGSSVQYSRLFVG